MSLYEFGRKGGILLKRELKEDDEDEDESSDEKDATFEAMNHEPSIIEEENPKRMQVLSCLVMKKLESEEPKRGIPIPS
ncbi:hypothetical protein M0R45_015144 [Rubus argutus]|uniref:Uncharacterized protein n=1 Tax=Rubus argutus TaxID=59490 RepID=A0AAW1XPN8_RUBAR